MGIAYGQQACNLGNGVGRVILHILSLSIFKLCTYTWSIYSKPKWIKFEIIYTFYFPPYVKMPRRRAQHTFLNAEIILSPRMRSCSIQQPCVNGTLGN